MRACYLLTVLAGVLALAGCDTKTPDDASLRNEVTEVPQEEPVESPAVRLPQGPTNMATGPANLAEPPQVSEEQQMLDDADATGLTTRLPEASEALPSSTEGVNGSAHPR